MRPSTRKYHPTSVDTESGSHWMCIRNWDTMRRLDDRNLLQFSHPIAASCCRRTRWRSSSHPATKRFASFARCALRAARGARHPLAIPKSHHRLPCRLPELPRRDARPRTTPLPRKAKRAGQSRSGNPRQTFPITVKLSRWNSQPHNTLKTQLATLQLGSFLPQAASSRATVSLFPRARKACSS